MFAFLFLNFQHYTALTENYLKLCRHDFVVCFLGALRDNNLPPHGNCTNHRDQVVASEQLAASPSGEFELSFLVVFSVILSVF